MSARKRKATGTAVGDGNADSGSVNEPDTDNVQADENPWIVREQLELLYLYRDFSDDFASDKVKKLHAVMSRHRKRNGEPAKPQRTEYEIKSKNRELKNGGITIEQLEAEFPEPVPDDKPAPKKRKTAPKVDKDHEYPAKAILEESKTHYKISWEDDAETGNNFEDTWEPKKNANQWLKDEWQAKQGKAEGGKTK